MYRSIVVGYDESSSSKAALKEAARWVKTHGGKLFIVHAVYFDQEEFTVLPSQMEKRFQFGAQVCQEAKLTMHDEFGLSGSIRSIVCEGEPPKMIIDAAREEHADLIALGTYGRKGLKRLFMGSVTSQVIQDAPCDVLVVNRECVSCTGNFTSLLVPFDGSDAGRKAVARACELSRFGGGRITVLAVVPRYADAMDFLKTEDLTHKMFQEAEKLLEAPKKIASERGVAVTTVVREGHAAEEIVAAAASGGNDLIVVGSPAWSGMERALMGGAVERIIAHAACPILVVK